MNRRRNTNRTTPRFGAGLDYLILLFLVGPPFALIVYLVAIGGPR